MDTKPVLFTQKGEGCHESEIESVYEQPCALYLVTLLIMVVKTYEDINQQKLWTWNLQCHIKV